MAIAHTRIMIGADVDTTVPPGQVGTITKRHYIEIGEKVTQEKLGVDDQTWEDYYADGVVSDEKLPEDLDHENESLNSYKVRNAVRLLEEASTRPEPEKRSRTAKKEE